METTSSQKVFDEGNTVESSSDHNMYTTSTERTGYTSSSFYGDYSREYYGAEELYEIYKTTELVELYWKPVLYIVGVLGNTLSLIVMASVSFRTVPLRFLLMAIAVLDLAVIFLSFFNYVSFYLISEENKFFRIFSPADSAHCKFSLFFFYYLTHLSAWSICLLSIDRLLVTWFPLRASELCSGKRIFLAWLGIAFILFFCDLHLFFTTYYLPDATFNCVLKAGTASLRAWAIAWDWLDLAIMCLIPFTIITICNCLVVNRLFVQRKLQAALTNNMTQSSSVRNLTITLVGVSVFFLLTTTPAAIFNIKYTWFLEEDTDPLTSAREHQIFTVLDCIYTLNHVSNFVFYFSFGKRFRHAFMVLFCRKTTQRETSSNFGYQSGIKGYSKEGDFRSLSSARNK